MGTDCGVCSNPISYGVEWECSRAIEASTNLACFELTAVVAAVFVSASIGFWDVVHN
jgi:hypothetical protein